MLRVLRPIVLTVFVLAFGVQSGISAEPGQGRARLEQFLAELTTLNARFEQQLFDEYGELLEESKGIVGIAKPGKFRWEYLEPYAQLIVTDGTTLWIYDADLEQVSVNPFTDNTAGTPAELLVGDIDLDSHYNVAEAPLDAGDVTWVALTPRDAGAQFNAIEIGLDTDGLRGMRLTDNLNQRTVISFENVVRNVEVDLAQFSFTPPPGVDVMSGGAN